MPIGGCTRSLLAWSVLTLSTAAAKAMRERGAADARCNGGRTDRALVGDAARLEDEDTIGALRAHSPQRPVNPALILSTSTHFGPPVPSLVCSSRNAPGATNVTRPPDNPSPHPQSSSLGLGMNHVALCERLDQPLDSSRAGIGTPGGCDPVEDGVAVRLVEP